MNPLSLLSGPAAGIGGGTGMGQSGPAQSAAKGSDADLVVNATTGSFITKSGGIDNQTLMVGAGVVGLVAIIYFIAK